MDSVVSSANVIAQLKSAQADSDQQPDAAESSVQAAPKPRSSKKRARRGPAEGADTQQQVSTCHLGKLPLEILAEILSYSPSPQDVLALARCSKYLCATLVDNPTTTFIWRYARARCQPDPIPDPTANFTEASYAAFLFDYGECDVCKRKTKAMYQSFALRVRLCGKSDCARDFDKSALLVVGRSVPARYENILSWISRAEANLNTPRIWDWDDLPRPIVKKRDWEAAVDECNKAMLSNTMDEHLRKKQAMADILPALMQLSGALVEWARKRKTRQTEVKTFNDAQARSIAIREGWTTSDLAQTESYGSFHRAMTAILEPVTIKQYALIRPTVEQDMIRIKERRERKEREHALQKRRANVTQHYDRLKSAEEKQVLPTLPEFRKFSIMKVFQASDTTEELSKELKNSKFIEQVLADNLEKWRENARASLAGVLGFSGWKTASRKKLHPVDRLTAMFSCKKCHKVAKKYREEDCLGFAGVCEHTCPDLNKRQRAKEIWSADNFEPDHHVIDAITQILTLCGTNAEDVNSLDMIAALGSRIVCLSCPPAIVMNFKTMIRHCKRHDENNFMILASEDLHMGHFPIEYGVAADLLSSFPDSEKRRALRIYGCRHCQEIRQFFKKIPAPLQDPQTHSRNRLALKNKVYNFDGLRSHAKEKHGIVRIGDEDFFRKKVQSTA